MKSNLIDLMMTLHHETHPGATNSGAVLVSLDGDRKKAVWLPKSVIEIEPDGRYYIITLPEQLAVDKGLV